MEINIRIDYPRPLTIVVFVGIIVAFVLSVGSVEAPIQADTQRGGGVFYRNGEEMPRGGADSGIRVTPEGYVRLLRLEQNVLTQKTQILRQQLVALERGGGGMRFSEMRDARQRLLTLFHDERALESALLASFREMRDARDHAQGIANGIVSPLRSPVAFVWPVEPMYGISAGFNDKSYERRFGFEHQAIDIPVEQGSIVYAAADGVVKEVFDRGLGFNSLVIAHNEGVATLYGHVREFLVSEGQSVHAGDPIALSGGMPGTRGAGMLSTGPHLHFEVIDGGVAIDPLPVLPQRLFNPTWVRVPTEFGARPDFSA